MLTPEQAGTSTLVAGATVGMHGDLILDRKLPLNPGEHVSLTISKTVTIGTVPLLDLQGTVLSYDNPFDSATPDDDWEASGEC